MIKNRGKVRGGGNSYGRFFIHVIPNGIIGEEVEEAMDRWSNEFGTDFKPNCGIPSGTSEFWAIVNTRAEFARLPGVVRKAQSIGWNVACSLWDEKGLGKVKLSESPELFWRELALAQAFYRE